MQQGFGIADELAYDVHESPLGDILAVSSARGLVAVGLPGIPHDEVFRQLAREWSVAPQPDDRALAPFWQQTDEYFAGRRKSFDTVLDLRGVPDFQLKVLHALAQIPHGHTHSYGQVAQGIGHPRASRAVGTACARNPLPLVVPCHRVVKADGSIGNYAGGVAMKSALLALEQA